MPSGTGIDGPRRGDGLEWQAKPSWEEMSVMKGGVAMAKGKSVQKKEAKKPKKDKATSAGKGGTKK